MLILQNIFRTCNDTVYHDIHNKQDRAPVISRLHIVTPPHTVSISVVHFTHTHTKLLGRPLYEYTQGGRVFQRWLQHCQVHQRPERTVLHWSRAQWIENLSGGNVHQQAACGAVLHHERRHQPHGMPIHRSVCLNV